MHIRQSAFSCDFVDRAVGRCEQVADVLDALFLYSRGDVVARSLFEYSAEIVNVQINEVGKT